MGLCTTCMCVTERQTLTKDAILNKQIVVFFSENLPFTSDFFPTYVGCKFGKTRGPGGEQWVAVGENSINLKTKF